MAKEVKLSKAAQQLLAKIRKEGSVKLVNGPRWSADELHAAGLIEPAWRIKVPRKPMVKPVVSVPAEPAKPVPTWMKNRV